MSVISNIDQLVRDDLDNVLSLRELVRCDPAYQARESEHALGGSRWRVERQIDANTWRGFNVRKRVYREVLAMREEVIA